MELLIVALFGAIIGSFLNVYIYRMHTGKSLGGRSHCMSCGITLVWYELLPAFSYLFLRGRCGHCSARISARYIFVELLTAGLFVLSYMLAGISLSTVLLWVMSAALVITLVYDLMHTIIPDEMVVVLLLAGLVLGFVENIQWLPHIGAAFGAAAFFGFFWVISRGRWMGLGDAKLALPLGLLLGPWGTISMLILSFWIGAAISLALLALQAGTTRMSFLPTHLTMKSEIPFAPFLIMGFVGVYFFHVDILTITDVLSHAILGY